MGKRDSSLVSHGETDRSRRSVPERVGTLHPFRESDRERIQVVIDRLGVKDPNIDGETLAAQGMTGWEAEEMERRIEIVAVDYPRADGRPSDRAAIFAKWCQKGTWRQRIHHKRWRSMPSPRCATVEMEQFIENLCERFDPAAQERKRLKEAEENRERRRLEYARKDIAEDWPKLTRALRRAKGKGYQNWLGWIDYVGAEHVAAAVGRDVLQRVLDLYVPKHQQPTIGPVSYRETAHARIRLRSSAIEQVNREAG